METSWRNYRQMKASIYWMLNFYSRCLTDDARCADLTLDELHILYQYDQSMVDFYRGALLLLEAKLLFGLIK